MNPYDMGLETAVKPLINNKAKAIGKKNNIQKQSQGLEPPYSKS